MEVRSPADEYMAQGKYAEAAEIYEQAIAADAANQTDYWHLGLAMLLQGDEAAAQFAWMTPLMEAEPDQAEQWVAELLQILQAAADHQVAIEAYETAWLLHQHMQEFDPGIARSLDIINLGLKAETLPFEEGLKQAIALLNEPASVMQPMALEVLQSIIQQLLAIHGGHTQINEFLLACTPHFVAQSQLSRLVRLLLEQAEYNSKISRRAVAVQLAKFCLKLAPDDDQVVAKIVGFMQGGNASNMLESLPLAKRLLQKTSSLTEQITLTQQILGGLMTTCGLSQETREYYQSYKNLLQSVYDCDVSQAEDIYLVISLGMFLNYFEDTPSTNRVIRNRIAEVCQRELRNILVDQVDRFSKRHLVRKLETKPLKIGYLSDCLRIHSVGWLARWLLQYHDRDRFEIHLYSTRQSDDPLQQALIHLYGDRFHSVPLTASEIADHIHQDGIDILVELDSLTSFTNCAVAALKPAPVQVTWLGYDASGLPAIDYYLADSYVLPDSAQSYYAEKIWRLPQTYIAIDGFEVGTPSLRRDQLGIPGDAVVYLSSQSGLKRHPDNIRLQMKILKAVPDSYFLIKSTNADRDLLSAFFYQLADEAGVNRDRLCFLPDVPANETHRANMGLADIVLDTYPYNGATTTLEALWMEIPIVTRVGEQFAARNSYTMMMNAGITEGIAWTDEEYVEWGVRLGEDALLRSNITHRLRQSRQTSPLWNARAFTQEVEQAYTQMWERYQAL